MRNVLPPSHRSRGYLSWLLQSALPSAGVPTSIGRSAAPTTALLLLLLVLVLRVPLHAYPLTSPPTIEELSPTAAQPLFLPTFAATGPGIALQNSLRLPMGATPTSVVMADIDRDRHPDLAVANKGSDSVSVFPNLRSCYPARFDPRSRVGFSVNKAPRRMALGDLNQDNVPTRQSVNKSHVKSERLHLDFTGDGAVDLEDFHEFAESFGLVYL